MHWCSQNSKHKQAAARRGAVLLKPQLRVRAFPENAPSKRTEEKKGKLEVLLAHLEAGGLGFS